MLQINWNEKDFHLKEIGGALRTANILDGYRESVTQYHLYGIKNDPANPHIEIIYPANQTKPEVATNLQDVVKFLTALSLNVVVKTAKKGSEMGNAMRIGVRMDVRKNVELAYALVSTVIHMAEGQLSISQAEYTSIKKVTVVFRKRELTEIKNRQVQAQLDAEKLLKLIEDFEGLAAVKAPVAAESSVEEA